MNGVVVVSLLLILNKEMWLLGSFSMLIDIFHKDHVNRISKGVLKISKKISSSN